MRTALVAVLTLVGVVLGGFLLLLATFAGAARYENDDATAVALLLGASGGLALGLGHLSHAVATRTWRGAWVCLALGAIGLGYAGYVLTRA